MKKPDKKVNSMILCIAELLVGILLLIKPVGFSPALLFAPVLA